MKIEIERLNSEEDLNELTDWYKKIEVDQKQSLEFKFEKDTIFTLKIDGQITGIMSVLEEGNEYSDLRRFVEKDHRGAGLAEMMLNYLIYYGKKNGIRRINGMLKTSNTKGTDYLKSKGFKITKFGKVQDQELSSAILKLN